MTRRTIAERTLLTQIDRINRDIAALNHDRNMLTVQIDTLQKQKDALYAEAIRLERIRHDPSRTADKPDSA